MLSLLKSGVLAAFIGLLIMPFAHAAETSLIYISARNCGYCRAYEASLEDQVKLVAKKHHTTYRTGSSPKIAVNSLQPD